MYIWTITLEDEVAIRIRNAYCKKYNYQDMIPNPEDPDELIPNPETKVNFTKRHIKRQIKDIVREVESTNAGNAASNEKLNEIETDVIINID